MEQAKVTEAVRLIWLGHEAKQIRTRLGIERKQWENMIRSPLFVELFDSMKIKRPEQLKELEFNLFNALEALKHVPESEKPRLLGRIEVMKGKYASFLL